MIAVPVWDAGFAEHPIHGVDGQRALLRAAYRHCSRRRTAIDAGAHVGLVAAELQRTFDEVLAFEPVVENYRCLRANAPGVRCFNSALGAEPGERAMRLPEYAKANSGQWHLCAGRGTMVATIDSFNLSTVDFIKIDTEGTEGEVILGARATIAKSRPTIIFEDNGNGPRYFGEAWVDPKPILTELGYLHVGRRHKDEIWRG